MKKDNNTLSGNKHKFYTFKCQTRSGGRYNVVNRLHSISLYEKCLHAYCYAFIFYFASN